MHSEFAWNPPSMGSLVCCLGPLKDLEFTMNDLNDLDRVFENGNWKRGFLYTVILR